MWLCPDPDVGWMKLCKLDKLCEPDKLQGVLRAGLVCVPSTEKKPAPEALITVCGPAQAGKTATRARLMYELDSLSDRDKTRLAREASEAGQETFAFWNARNIREKASAHLYAREMDPEFTTCRFQYRVLEDPGHREFFRKMVQGETTDVVLVVVSVLDLDLAVNKHELNRLRWFGCRLFVFIVNKMDAVDFREERFNQVCDQVQAELAWEAGKTVFVFVPVSSLQNDNIVRTSGRMPWWQGSDVRPDVRRVYTLLDCLDVLVRVPDRTKRALLPVRMSLSGAYDIRRSGKFLTGKLDQGTLAIGQKVGFFPRRHGRPVEATVVSIQRARQDVMCAGPDQEIGFQVELTAEMPERGDVMVPQGVVLESCKSVRARVVRTGSKLPGVGSTLRAQVQCALVSVTLSTMEQTGTWRVATFVPTEAVVIENRSRVVLVMLGQVVEV